MPQYLTRARTMLAGTSGEAPAVLFLDTGPAAALGALQDPTVAEHNEQLVRFCKRHGIPFAQHRLDESLESFMVRTLPTRGFVQ